MSDFDLIIGVHSIAAALNNPKRAIKHIFFSEEGKKDLLKRSNIRESDFAKY
jgi:tRNA G18 (ribose-2'-O)-methylase SpoU